VPLHRDRGSALVADLALAAAVVLVVASATTAVGTVIAAREATLEAARMGAVTAARLGDPVAARSAAASVAPPGSVITVEADGEVARAVVTVGVELSHPLSRRVALILTEWVDMPIAPYRSNRG
jgi:hypothetical protein